MKEILKERVRRVKKMADEEKVDFNAKPERDVPGWAGIMP